MLPSEVHIDNLSIQMIHCHRFVNNAIFPQNDIRTGEITTGKYNIDEITKEVNPEDIDFYYPKRIWTLLIPFLKKIIEDSIVIKCIYSFGLNQHDPYQNPYDIQGINKDIDVVLDFESPNGTAERLSKDCLNNLEDDRRALMWELAEGVTLSVVRIEVFGKLSNPSLPMFNTYKEDNCIICIEDKPNILFCNCGHLVLCESCYKKLENLNCPKCRLHNTIIRRL